MKAFNGEDLTATMRGFTLGYVRPAGGLDSLTHRMQVLNQLNLIKGFYKKGGKVQSYADGNALVYNPLGAVNQNAKESPYGTLTYKPFIGVQSTGDPMLDFIYEGFTPSFPVEPVSAPVIQQSDKKEEPKKVEIDLSSSVNNDVAEEVVDETPESVVETTSKPTPPSIKVVTLKRQNQQETPVVTAVTDPTKVVTPKIPKGVVEYTKQNLDVGNMQELVNLMIEEGISFRITSGYRPGAKTKQGRPSHHGAGNAMDITPINGQT